MKKTVALLLALAMLFSLTACGNNPKETEAPTDAPKQTDAPAQTDAPDVTEAPTEEPETDAPVNTGKITYEDYLNMSGAEQQEFIMSFGDPAAFFAWLEAAKAEYEANNPSIDIGDGSDIDIGDLIG